MPHIIGLTEDDFDDPDATTGGYTYVLQKDPTTGGYWPGDLAKDPATGGYELPE